MVPAGPAPIRGLTNATEVARVLLMPGGDREGGLAQITDARDYGQLVRGEADYQLHLIYLWYEKRWSRR